MRSIFFFFLILDTFPFSTPAFLICTKMVPLYEQTNTTRPVLKGKKKILSVTVSKRSKNISLEQGVKNQEFLGSFN